MTTRPTVEGVSERKLSKAPPVPPEVQVSAALAQASKALDVLFTMLRKVEPQGASVADEINGEVKCAQKNYQTVIHELLAARQQLAELREDSAGLVREVHRHNEICEALKQQLAEMRANDVRYRHIRSEECGLTLKHDLLFGEDLDAQLDAEIARLPAALAPTSQPSRGKCETFLINGGYVVTEKESSRCIHGVQLVQRGSDGYRACGKCFAFLHPRPDCAQPERQGADTIRVLCDNGIALAKRRDEMTGGREGAEHHGDYEKLFREIKRALRPSPPQDDIVAGLRLVSNELGKQQRYAMRTRVDRAIAALGEKGWNSSHKMDAHCIACGLSTEDWRIKQACDP